MEHTPKEEGRFQMSVGDTTEIHSKLFPKEEEIREIEIFSLPSQDELRNEWVEFLRSAPNVDAEAIEWIVANFVEEKLVDLLNSQIKIRREAIAERDEEIKKMVERMDDSGGGSGRRLKLQILDYLTQE